MRYGAKVHRLNTQPWGTAYSYDAIAREVASVKPKVLALVHAETSTGVLQPLEGLGDLCRSHDCLLLVDSVSRYRVLSSLSLCALAHACVSVSGRCGTWLWAYGLF